MGMAQCGGTNGLAGSEARRCGLAPNHDGDCKFAPRDAITIQRERRGYRPPPDHYSTGAGIDPWAVWDAFDLDRYTANAVKYLLRAGKKDGESRLKDLMKAKDYVLKAIEREEAK